MNTLLSVCRDFLSNDGVIMGLLIMSLLFFTIQAFGFRNDLFELIRKKHSKITIKRRIKSDMMGKIAVNRFIIWFFYSSFKSELPWHRLFFYRFTACMSLIELLLLPLFVYLFKNELFDYTLRCIVFSLFVASCIMAGIGAYYHFCYWVRHGKDGSKQQNYRKNKSGHI